MKDPYETLGVRRNASTKTIRKAYRQLAKASHPDHNPGDESVVERYRAVVAAYELLSDPERRKCFNETGETDAPKQVSPDAEFAATVHPFLCGVVSEMVKQGISIESNDVLMAIRDNMKQHQKDFKAQHDRLVKIKKALAAVAERFTSEDEGNILASLTRSQLSVIDQEIATALANFERMSRSLDKLKLYGYKFVAQAAPRLWLTAASTSTASW